MVLAVSSEGITTVEALSGEDQGSVFIENIVYVWPAPLCARRSISQSVNQYCVREACFALLGHVRRLFIYSSVKMNRCVAMHPLALVDSLHHS